MKDGKFEVGDIVKRIRGENGGMFEGDIGRILAISAASSDNSVSLDIENFGHGHDGKNFELVKRGKTSKIKVVHPQFLAIIKSCSNLRLVQDKKALSEMKENAKIYKLIPLYELEEKREFVKKKME